MLKFEVKAKKDFRYHIREQVERVGVDKRICKPPPILGLLPLEKQQFTVHYTVCVVVAHSVLDENDDFDSNGSYRQYWKRPNAKWVLNPVKLKKNQQIYLRIGERLFYRFLKKYCL